MPALCDLPEAAKGAGARDRIRAPVLSSYSRILLIK